MALSLFPNNHILTKEIESWKCFADGLSSKEDSKLFRTSLNDCYIYASAAINAKGQPFSSEPLIMALLFIQHKMIDWLTKQISKRESLVNKESLGMQRTKRIKLDRVNKRDYLRKNRKIHYIDDDD